MLKIEDVNASNFENIPNPCKYCLYWQTNGEFNDKMLKPEMEHEKREWFNKTDKEFEGSLKIAYYNDVPIGFIQLAMPKHFPRTGKQVSGQPSNDAVFIHAST